MKLTWQEHLDDTIKAVAGYVGIGLVAVLMLAIMFGTFFVLVRITKWIWAL